MKDYSVFDIIGPCMIGPSSSHTAGAARIGYIAYRIAHGRPEKAHVTLYGSFAETGAGHGTDRAVIGGILGFSPDDSRLKDSLEIAEGEHRDYTVEFSEEKAAHPNTARISIELADGRCYDITGISTGGGNIEILNINGMEVSFSADYPTILVFYQDQPGMISAVSGVIAQYRINIAFMKVFRTSRKQQACMVLETDETVPEGLSERIKELNESIEEVCVL